MGVRVVVGGSRNLVRRGIRALLQEADGVDVVATCGDATSALSSIAVHDPDAVILHVFLGEAGRGADLAVQLREERPALGVVLLLGEGDPREVARVLEQGTQRRALLLLDHPAIHVDLVTAVHEVVEGGSMVHPGVVDLVLRAVRVHVDPLAGLTPRERQVLDQMAKGASNAEIGRVLDLSQRAVEKHINQLYPKLGLPVTGDVHRRVAAVVRYLATTRGGGNTTPTGEATPFTGGQP